MVAPTCSSSVTHIEGQRLGSEQKGTAAGSSMIDRSVLVLEEIDLLLGIDNMFVNQHCDPIQAAGLPH